MRIFFLSPHTDDIELGAGGILVKLLQQKNVDICWAVFSICEDAVPEGLPPDTLRNEFLNIINKLGINNYYTFNFQNMNFPSHRQKILHELNKIKKEFEPSLVIAPSINDSHQDHKTIAEETIRVFKRDTSIIGYELPWNNLVFNPQLFVRLIKEQMDEKWKLLSMYKSQFILRRDYFSREFIFGWARMRGVQCNCEYAEAFEVIRWMM